VNPVQSWLSMAVIVASPGPPRDSAPVQLRKCDSHLGRGWARGGRCDSRRVNNEPGTITRLQPSCKAPGTRPWPRLRGSLLSLPSPLSPPGPGIVRASSVFPILSAILLLVGGLCLGAGRIYSRRNNIVLSAGILFVAAGESPARMAPLTLVPDRSWGCGEEVAIWSPLHPGRRQTVK
jgi:hypothetical protein